MPALALAGALWPSLSVSVRVAAAASSSSSAAAAAAASVLSSSSLLDAVVRDAPSTLSCFGPDPESLWQVTTLLGIYSVTLVVCLTALACIGCRLDGGSKNDSAINSNSAASSSSSSSATASAAYASSASAAAATAYSSTVESLSNANASSDDTDTQYQFFRRAALTLALLLVSVRIVYFATDLQYKDAPAPCAPLALLFAGGASFLFLMLSILAFWITKFHQLTLRIVVIPTLVVMILLVIVMSTFVVLLYNTPYVLINGQLDPDSTFFKLLSALEIVDGACDLITAIAFFVYSVLIGRMIYKYQIFSPKLRRFLVVTVIFDVTLVVRMIVIVAIRDSYTELQRVIVLVVYVACEIFPVLLVFAMVLVRTPATRARFSGNKETSRLVPDSDQ